MEILELDCRDCAEDKKSHEDIKEAIVDTRSELGVTSYHPTYYNPISRSCYDNQTQEEYETVKAELLKEFKRTCNTHRMTLPDKVVVARHNFAVSVCCPYLERY